MATNTTVLNSKQTPSGLGTHATAIDYQLQVGLLLALRALKCDLNFELEGEKCDVGKFGDTVFRFTNDNNSKEEYFIQITRGRDYSKKNNEELMEGWMLLKPPGKQHRGKLRDKVYLKHFVDSFKAIRNKNPSDVENQYFILYTSIGMKFSEDFSTNGKRKVDFQFEGKNVTLWFEEFSYDHNSQHLIRIFQTPYYKLLYNEDVTFADSDVSEIQDFLDHFYFFINQPAEEQLRNIIKDEVSSILDERSEERITEVYLQLMDFLRVELKTKPTYKMTSNMVKEILTKEAQKNLNAFSTYISNVRNSDQIEFQKDLKPLKKFLEDEQKMFLHILCSHDPHFNFINVQQTIRKLKRYCPYESPFTFISDLSLLKYPNMTEDLFFVLNSSESCIIVILLESKELELEESNFLKQISSILKCQNISHCRSKKLITISTRNLGHQIESMFNGMYNSIETPVATLALLAQEWQEKLLKRDIIFQGKRLPLGNLIISEQSILMDKIVLSISAFTNEIVLIGQPVLPTVDSNIPLMNRRLLRYNILKRECLISNRQDIFALTGDLEEIHKYLKGEKKVIEFCNKSELSKLNDNGLIIFIRNPAEDFKKLCEIFTERNVNWVHLEEGHIFCVRSHNYHPRIKDYLHSNENVIADINFLNCSKRYHSLLGVKYYLNRLQAKELFRYYICEDFESIKSPESEETKDLFSDYLTLRELTECTSKQVHFPRIIAGESGMGKTTLLKLVCSQRKLLKSDTWVLYLDATMVSKHLLTLNDNRGNVNEIQFLCDCQELHEGLERNFFEYWYKYKEVLLVLDDYHLIPDQYRICLCIILRKISYQPSVILWVGTENNCKNELEISLGVISFELSSLSANEQIDYLQKLWWKRLDAGKVNNIHSLSRQFIEKLRYRMRLAESQLIHTPLLVQVIGKMYEEECKSFCENMSKS